MKFLYMFIFILFAGVLFLGKGNTLMAEGPPDEGRLTELSCEGPTGLHCDPGRNDYLVGNINNLINPLSLILSRETKTGLKSLNKKGYTEIPIPNQRLPDFILAQKNRKQDM